MDKASHTDHIINIGGLIVDTLTGEILGHSEHSAFSGTMNYQGELRVCRSVDDFEDYLSFVDRRKLPAHELHTLRDEVDHAHGIWRLKGHDCRITLPQQRLLEKLHGLVRYHNMIFMTKAGLARALGLAESNLMKKLRTLTDANMLIVRTSRNNIRAGEIKLTINPRLIFRGSDLAKERYIQYWYRPVSWLNQGEADITDNPEAAAPSA